MTQNFSEFLKLEDYKYISYLRAFGRREKWKDGVGWGLMEELQDMVEGLKERMDWRAIKNPRRKPNFDTS